MEQARITAAHIEAFSSVLQFLHKHIIQENNIMQLSSFRLIYIDNLGECDYPNEKYRRENLMKQLQNYPDISS